MFRQRGCDVLLDALSHSSCASFRPHTRSFRQNVKTTKTASKNYIFTWNYFILQPLFSLEILHQYFLRTFDIVCKNEVKDASVYTTVFTVRSTAGSWSPESSLNLPDLTHLHPSKAVSNRMIRAQLASTREGKNNLQGKT